jgi:hypothetical protein
MRTTTLTTALTILLVGCGFDSGPTAPEGAGPAVPEPALPVAEPEFAAAQALSTNVWTTKAPMPTAQRYFAAGVVNGVLYTVGGENSNDAPQTLVQAYTPGDNSWRTKAPLPAGRAYLNGAGVINGVLYLAGGLEGNTQVTSDLFAYTPSTNTWTRKQVMLAGGAHGASGVIGGKLYVYSTTYQSATFQRYDPATNTWEYSDRWEVLPSGRARLQRGPVRQGGGL